MKIYTRTGDDGTTGLFGGGRVAKADPRVEAYGSVDETGAALGMARAAGLPPDVDALLDSVQAELFVLGAELATLPEHQERLRLALIDDVAVERLEAAIDRAEGELPPLSSFVLAGGCPAGAALHLARTVCRRAERALTQVDARPELLRYVNRLSDLLFVLARLVNHRHGTPEKPWNPHGR